MPSQAVTLYHNPACGTSRNTLAMIRNAGIEPVVIEYLKAPFTRAALKKLIADSGLKVRDFLREKEKLVDELGLKNPSVREAAIIDAIVAHPILFNRPVVATELGIRVCRPSELVLDILPSPQHGEFTKEDGEAVVDASGQRVGEK